MEDGKKESPRWISGIEPAKELLAANGTEILEWECREQPSRLSELIRFYAIDADLRAEMRLACCFAPVRADNHIDVVAAIAADDAGSSRSGATKPLPAKRRQKWPWLQNAFFWQSGTSLRERMVCTMVKQKLSDNAL